MLAIGGRIAAALNAAGEHAASVAVDEIAGARIGTGEMAAISGPGRALRAYRFDKYRTREKPEQKQTLKRLTFMLERSRCGEEGLRSRWRRSPRA